MDFKSDPTGHRGFAEVGQWLLGPDGELVNPATDRCLDDPDSTVTTGVPLDLYTCTGTGAQVWHSAA